MLFVFIALGALALLWISLLAIRAMDPPFDSQLRSLRQQHDKLSGILSKFIEEMSPSETCCPPCTDLASEEFWASLAQGDSAQALLSAERALADANEAPEPRLLLAMVLSAGAHYPPANAQLESAKRLGATGPFLLYLESTIEVDQYLGSFVDPDSPTEYATVKPVEVLATQLRSGMEDSGDASDLWMPDNDTQVATEDVKVFVVSHFSRYYAILTDMLTSLRTTPYNDGLYFVARLALASGFPNEGREMYFALEGSMKGSRLRHSFKRDLATIRGQTEWKHQPNPGEKGRTRLRVLP